MVQRHTGELWGLLSLHVAGISYYNTEGTGIVPHDTRVIQLDSGVAEQDTVASHGPLRLWIWVSSSLLREAFVLYQGEV